MRYDIYIPPLPRGTVRQNFRSCLHRPWKTNEISFLPQPALGKQNDSPLPSPAKGKQNKILLAFTGQGKTAQDFLLASTGQGKTE